VGFWRGPNFLNERQRFYGQVFLACAGIALMLGWGYHTPLYRILFEVPLMNKWRDPLKWLEWTNFAMVVLSAYGLNYLIALMETSVPEAKAARRGVLWFIGGIGVLLGLGLLGSYIMDDVLVEKLRGDGYEAEQISSIQATLHLSLALALVLTVLLGLLVRGLWKPESGRTWKLVNPLLDRLWQRMLAPEFLPLTLALGVAALAVGQLAWVTGHFIEPVRLKVLQTSDPLLERLRSEGDQVRVAVPDQDSYLNVVLQNQFYAFHISCLDISAASRIPDNLSTFFRSLEGNHARLWLLAGVKNVVVPQESMPRLEHDAAIAANIDHADGYTVIPTRDNLPSHAVVQMRDYLAKATLVPGAEIIPDEAALLKRLADPAWNPRRTVLLDSAAPVTEGGSAGSGAGLAEQAAVELYTSQEIKVRVQSQKGGYVLINDAYDPDWEAEVNGVPAPLLRADYLLRAVPVRGGVSTVTLRYVAHYRVLGWPLRAEAMNDFCDVTMLAAWGVAGVVVWRRRRVD